MSYADERFAIEGRFATQWAAGSYPTIPYCFDNEALPDAAVYLVVSITSGFGTPKRAGTVKEYRQRGLIQVDAITPEGQGSHQARQLLDAVGAIFRGVQFSAGSSGLITCGATSIRPVGSVDGKYRLVLTVDFYRDATYS